MLSSLQIDEFISQHRLPDKFRDLIKLHYLPLASWVKSQGETDRHCLSELTERRARESRR